MNRRSDRDGTRYAAPETALRDDRAIDLVALLRDIRAWGRELGFQAIGVADVDLSEAEPRLLEWLARGFHGSMDYMSRHGRRRARPAELVPGTVRVISARMDYLAAAPPSLDTLVPQDRACIARYAQGRDYHKVLRTRLQRLVDRIAAVTGPFGHRVFTDSAPVMEVELARNAGLGWRGKHTLLIDRDHGSYFFLGEIFVDLPLPLDAAVSDHCGSCTRCITACPTGAIVAPYVVDARRCISYLTIEEPGAIPEHLRSLIGNRVYGCDDCQAACPWNRFARASDEPDFRARHGLDRATLIELFAWTESEFRERMAGSAIWRIGYERWLRNLAVGLGNAPTSPEVIEALRHREGHPSGMVREHVAWALARHSA